MVNDRLIKVVLIEDNPADTRLIQEMLAAARGASFNLECTDQLSSGLARLAAGDIDIALVDLSLPDSCGLDTFAQVRAQAPQVPIVVLTGLDDEELAVKAVQEGAQDYLVKGQVDSSLLARAMRYAIERQRAEEALRKAHEELERRVEERTAELSRANVLLEQEVAERKRAEETLRQRNRELALLNRVVQTLNSSLKLDQVFVTLLEEVRHLLGVTACSVWLVDSEMDELVCQQTSGLGSETVRGWRLAPGEGLADWVARSGESLIVPDTRADERHFKGVEQQIGLELRSILTIPLKVKQDIIGVLQVVDTEVGRFDAADLALLEPVAASAATAIENARLYEETDRLRSFNENIVQSMEEGILIEDITGHIIFVNPKISELLGYASEELTGRHWTTIVSPDYMAKVGAEIAKRRQDVASRYEAALLTREGQQVPVIVSTQPLYGGALSVFTDITARKWAEEELQQYAERLRALAARLAEAEDAERRRLARELHDQVGQNLSALNINLSIVRAQLPEGLAGLVRSRLDDSVELVKQVAKRVQDVMADLRSPVLEDYGLVAALHWYGAQFATRTGIEVVVRGKEPTPRLSTSVENALFRIAQEALTNVAKHAQATQVSVTVELDNGTMWLIIADDGVGFDPARSAALTERPSWGMISMTERAEAVGGHCRIEARPQQGTRVIVEICKSANEQIGK